MKILSDWSLGNPPMPGMWLVRLREQRPFDSGALRRWTGVHWAWWDGSWWWNAAPEVLEWRGLAFDPTKAIALPKSNSTLTVPANKNFYVIEGP